MLQFKVLIQSFNILCIQCSYSWWTSKIAFHFLIFVPSIEGRMITFENKNVKRLFSNLLSWSIPEKARQIETESYINDFTIFDDKLYKAFFVCMKPVCLYKTTEIQYKWCISRGVQVVEGKMKGGGSIKTIKLVLKGKNWKRKF